jgi:DMSO reductase family type II enzyme heme b subunit
MRAISSFAALLLLAAPAALAELATEPVEPTPVAAVPEQGQQLYRRHCEQCHGIEGKGDGPAADLVYPRPRDFTLALYKVRSTLSGQVPTDHDLFRVISEGLPGTSMPPWKKVLGEAERWQLVHHVKTFDAVGAFADEPAKKQIALGMPPKVTAELIARGKRLYQDKKCWQCHGQMGRGDGPSAQGLKDDWGFAIRPVNFTKSWRFRGGDTLADIYRTFTTGFNGTPMPSFLTAIPEATDRWALAAYVKSLAQPMRFSQVLRAEWHSGEIPADPGAAVWANAEAVDFPLAGQIVLEPRWFKPAHDVVSAKALYNDRELALLVIWDDGTRNDGTDNKPLDRVAVQSPLDDPATADGERPYFILGDRKHGVDYWQWSADGTLGRQRIFGASRREAHPSSSLKVAGAYQDGQYQVMFRRPLTGGDEVSLKAGTFLPIAFHLWDGANGEEGLKMALSAWAYLLLVPDVPFTVFLWPGLLGLLAVGGEAWLIRHLRRQAVAVLAFLALSPAASAADYQRIVVNEPAPAFQLLDQNGRRASLADFRGKVTVLTFFYSTCVDVCPVLLQTLGTAEDMLDPKEIDRVRFVAVTVDAGRDTTKRLKTFMAERGLRAKAWRLLTGSILDLTGVADAYGAVVRPGPGGDFVHNSVFVVIDGKGINRVELHGAATPPEAPVGEIRAILKREG